ncbi:hypothetical protein FIBSPDRAFT_1043826 [Athelia psychrophila]|uniref:Uncharacterized protein n=1 Tax=Athelia psychrophila TaxID=1759441 RepID=A0A166KPH0_9AGAM|nr:hypothetical protein FIBSPDRAFT_1043826 [Fibularhizoctonia sp. CBS 109695]
MTCHPAFGHSLPSKKNLLMPPSRKKARSDVMDKLTLDSPPQTERSLPVSISSIANELLSRIFTLATHDSHDPYDAILYPIIVSHVCATWRQVALSTSELWTSIILTHPSPWSQLSRTIAYLSRSRRRPLSLFLDFRDPAWDWSEDSHSFSWKHMENVIRLLSPHVLRWRCLELLTDTWSPIFTFLWYIRRVPSAPMLEDISISRCNVYFAAQGVTFEPVALKEPVALFGGGGALKSLRRVVLAGVHCDWANSGLQGLEDLELKYQAMDVMPSLPQFVDILKKCPKLRRLAIFGWGPRAETMPDKGTGRESSPLSVGKFCGSVCLPHLEHFILGFLDVEYATDLLSLFCFPALKSLTLEDISPTLDPADHQDASQIFEFLASNASSGPPPSHPSTCTNTQCFPLANIIHLELRSVQASQLEIRRFLLKLPSLQRLSLTNMGRDIFTALGHIDAPASSTATTPAVSSHPFCLQHVTCVQVDRKALVAFAQLPVERKPLAPHCRLTLDIRGEGLALSGVPRVELIEAGVIIIADDSRARRPSLALLPRDENAASAPTPPAPTEDSLAGSLSEPEIVAKDDGSPRRPSPPADNASLVPASTSAGDLKGATSPELTDY